MSIEQYLEREEDLNKTEEFTEAKRVLFQNKNVTTIFDVRFDMFPLEEQPYYYAEDLCVALEYVRPDNGVRDIISRKRDRLEKHIRCFPLSSVSTNLSELSNSELAIKLLKKELVLCRQGGYLFVAFSGKEKSNDFIEFLVSQEVKREKKQLAYKRDPLLMVKDICKAIEIATDDMLLVKEEVGFLKEEVKVIPEIQTKIAAIELEQQTLTREEKQYIQRRKREMYEEGLKDEYSSLRGRQILSKVSWLVNEYFNVNSYGEIPRSRFQEVKWILEKFYEFAMSRKLDLSKFWTRSQLLDFCRRKELIWRQNKE